jgi:drug/metabolite transporter (DMT)-like permease
VTAAARPGARHRDDLPIIAASIAIVAWGVGPLIVRGISASTATIVFFRLWLAVPVMAVVARLTGRGINRTSMRATFVPAVAFSISIVTSFAAFRTTSIANATLIPSMSPVLLMTAAHLRGHRHSHRQLAGAALGVVGVVVVVLGAGVSSGATLGGDLLATVELFTWSLYLVLARRVRVGGTDAGSYIGSVFLWSAILCTPWALASGLAPADLGAGDVGLIVAMVFIPGLLGHGSMSWAQRHLTVTVVALMSLANPVLSSVGAWIVFDQALSTAQIAGSVLVLAGLSAVVADQRAVGHAPDEDEFGVRETLRE